MKAEAHPNIRVKPHVANQSRWLAGLLGIPMREVNDLVVVEHIQNHESAIDKATAAYMGRGPLREVIAELRDQLSGRPSS